MKTFKNILEFIGILFWVYLVFSIIAWEYNPGEWAGAGRISMIALASFLWCIIQIGADHDS